MCSSLLYGRFCDWMTSQFSELVEDFSEPVVVDDDSAEDDSEGDPLTVRKLKDNLVRFSLYEYCVSWLASFLDPLLIYISTNTQLYHILFGQIKQLKT
ncbi:uncharacterized protein [Parasteatoda tepidariorum]|uniref:uncharacterized protein isoform X2 n=1 Tax=Parasteatoda tepidariorum TaxID=114398 RepID=UPI0039BCA684